MKDIKGVGQKWPKMVVKWIILTTRLGETVFNRYGTKYMFGKSSNDAVINSILPRKTEKND